MAEYETGRPMADPGDDAHAGTSGGSGTGMEGLGISAAGGVEEGGTGAGRGTGAAGPGTTAGNGPAGTRSGAEEGAIGSGYGGSVTPGGPTGEPTAEQQAHATTLDGMIGADPAGILDEVRQDPNSAQQRMSDEDEDRVSVASEDSFPASDPPAY